MNRTAVTVAFFVLVALSVIGGTAIMLLRPDMFGAYMAMMVSLVGIGSTGAMNFAQIRDVKRDVAAVKGKTDTVAKNVNGNLTRLINVIESRIPGHDIEKIKSDAQELID